MDICRQAVLSTLRCSCRSRSWGCWALPENGEDLTLCILVCSNLVEWSALSEQRSTANSSLQRLKAELQGKDNKKNAIWNDSGGIGIFVITIYTSYHKLLSNSNTSGNQPCCILRPGFRLFSAPFSQMEVQAVLLVFLQHPGQTQLCIWTENGVGTRWGPMKWRQWELGGNFWNYTELYPVFGQTNMKGEDLGMGWR